MTLFTQQDLSLVSVTQKQNCKRLWSGVGAGGVGMQAYPQKFDLSKIRQKSFENFNNNNEIMPPCYW